MEPALELFQGFAEPRMPRHHGQGLAHLRFQRAAQRLHGSGDDLADGFGEDVATAAASA